MLDNLAVRVETEDVDARVVVGTGPRLVAVQNDVLPLSDGADEVDAIRNILSQVNPTTGYIE